MALTIPSAYQLGAAYSAPLPTLPDGSATPSDTNPLMDGTAAPGTSLLYTRGDHIHPTDTTRAALTQVVRYDTAQSLTSAQQKQARSNLATPDANVIINGDFRINQAGYVSAAVLGAGVYGHDQWKAGASGGNYSFTQLKSSTQITIAANKSLIQPIEDANVVGGSYVLSWTGTAQARAGVNTLTPSGSYAVSPLLITGQTAGTVMSVEFNSGTLGTVKLESGTLATPYVMRPYDQEWAACKRYFQRETYRFYYLAPSGMPALSGVQNSISILTMRAVPTVLSVTGADLAGGTSGWGATAYSPVSINIIADTGVGLGVYQAAITPSLDARL